MRQASAFDARPQAGARVTDKGWPFAQGDHVQVPIPAFLVEHPDAGPVLVDTGLHASVATNPRANLGRVGTFFMDPRMEPGQSAREQLERRGVDPGAIGTVVLTHLHVDHASAVSEFPDAAFYVDRREWDEAIAAGDHPSYHRPQFDLPLDWRLMDFERDGPGGASGFPGAVDLLGDGSIFVLPTPGHSAGHLSVLVRLARRDVLLAGDAAFTRRALDHGTMPMYLHDEDNFRRSLDAIRRWCAEHPDALVIPGHDRLELPRLGSVVQA